MRNLIYAGLVPDGEVDQRNIREIDSHDLKGFIQCHFFCGILGWPLALALAGWPTDRPVWTGSCPCQPFSSAGKGLAEKDERHLWPDWFQLIRQCEPATVFGEQVAGKRGRKWLAGVRADLETLGYAVGAADLCAACVGSPQIRQRLWWVAYAGGGSDQRQVECEEGIREDAAGPAGGPGGCGSAGGASHTSESGLEEWQVESTREKRQTIERSYDAGRLSDAPISRNRAYDGQSGAGTQPQVSAGGHDLPSGIHNTDSDERQEGEQASPPMGHGDTIEPANYWSDFDILPFQDGKARRVEPGTFPLVARIPGGVVPSGDPSVSYAQATAEACVMRLKGYGNSIVPQVTAVFIRACEEVLRQ